MKFRDRRVQIAWLREVSTGKILELNFSVKVLAILCWWMKTDRANSKWVLHGRSIVYHWWSNCVHIKRLHGPVTGMVPILVNPGLKETINLFFPSQRGTGARYLFLGRETGDFPSIWAWIIVFFLQWKRFPLMLFATFIQCYLTAVPT